MLHIATSAATLKVKELEKLGLVSKTQSEEDKRVYYLTVNEAVRAEYKAYDQSLYAALDQVERPLRTRTGGHVLRHAANHSSVFLRLEKGEEK